VTRAVRGFARVRVVAVFAYSGGHLDALLKVHGGACVVGVLLKEDACDPCWRDLVPVGKGGVMRREPGL
jgi:hypothetical protein